MSKPSSKPGGRALNAAVSSLLSAAVKVTVSSAKAKPETQGGHLMMYSVQYVRDGKPEVHLMSYAQAMALADYLKRTFRITAEVRRSA